MRSLYSLDNKEQVFKGVMKPTPKPQPRQPVKPEDRPKYDYIIVGDTDEYDGCLVYVCSGRKEFAESVLERMLTEPTEQDKRELERFRNLRVEAVEREKAWWNDPFLAN
jgi:hypothetical protein